MLFRSLTPGVAVALASATPGVSGVRPYSKEESGRLLEPWLGSGLALDELPVPRMILVRITPGETPDLAPLRRQLAEQIPGSSLDDHRGWVDRMRAMARSAVAVGLAILAMVLFALVALISDWFKGSAGESQAGALFGNLSLGLAGYGAMIGLVVLVAAVTAGTSRLTVQRTLRSME